MQLFTPIQLISFWFHEICMDCQQVLGRELWFPGDVARCGGGIQITHCSKLAPCVFSVLHCRKNSVEALQLKSFTVWNSEIKSYTLPQMFHHPFNPSGSERLPAAPIQCRVLTGRCIPVMSWWMDPQVKWMSTASVVISLCGDRRQTLSQQTKLDFKHGKQQQHLNRSQLFLLSAKFLAAKKNNTTAMWNLNLLWIKRCVKSYCCWTSSVNVRYHPVCFGKFLLTVFKMLI